MIVMTVTVKQNSVINCNNNDDDIIINSHQQHKLNSQMVAMTARAM